MSLVAAVIAALGALLALVFRLFLGERTKRIGAEQARDAQVAARKDDVGRLEDVVATKNVSEEQARANVPTDIVSVRDAVAKLGGVPLPDPKGKGKK